MNTIKKSDLPIKGDPLGGGFYVGLIKIKGATHALIVSPKNEGELIGQWGHRGVKIKDADSCFNGLSNTIEMSEAGSVLAKRIRALRIGGNDDWAIPSRDEKEIIYRTFKPTTTENYCSFRDGDNASSIPAGYPYTEQNPLQTPIPDFQEGGEQAFEPEYYWTSTQYSADTAFYQDFDGGSQYYDVKYYALRARAVRRLLVIE
jgi:hypothetical protein